MLVEYFVHFMTANIFVIMNYFIQSQTISQSVHGKSLELSRLSKSHMMIRMTQNFLHNSYHWNSFTWIIYWQDWLIHSPR